MASLLHLIASPRPESYSTRVANEFTAAYRQTHPADRVEQLDLFRAEIPPFLAPAAKAKYAVMGGQAPKDEAEAAWAGVIKTIVHFKGFDKYVLSSAMWNFGIPYRLKQYIDVIVQPGLSFAYSPDKGYTGLVVGKPLRAGPGPRRDLRAGQSLRNLRFPGDLSPRRLRLHRLYGHQDDLRSGDAPERAGASRGRRPRRAGRRPPGRRRFLRSAARLAEPSACSRRCGGYG